MALRNQATVAVLLLGLLLIPNFASAASGGRVGGSFFPSSSGGKKSSSSSSSRPPSWSSHSSRHYDPPQSFYWTPSPPSFPSTPSPPSPTTFHSTPSPPSFPSTPSPPSFPSTPPPPSFHSTPSPPSTCSHSSDGDGDFLVILMILLVVIVCLAIFCDCCTAEKTSVVKLQVGLLGKARSLQRDLNRITETANTSTSKGLSYVLTGATTALLRNLDYCISSYSSVKRKCEIEEAEECFKLLSMEEAAKFDEVTLANVNNFKTRSKSQSPNEFHKEYIVVTILVATHGVQKLPTINGTGDLKKALQTLGAIPSSKIMAVEVLWTPQQENDTLTEKEILKDYPNLRGFYEEAFEEGTSEDQQPFLGANVL